MTIGRLSLAEIAVIDAGGDVARNTSCGNARDVRLPSGRISDRSMCRRRGCELCALKRAWRTYRRNVRNVRKWARGRAK